jgi:integrase
MIAAAAAKDPAQGVLLALAATTGGRRGELCALRWSDIDLDVGLVHIRRALKQVGRVVTEGATKTHQERTLALPAELVRLLSEYRAIVADETTRGGFQLSDDPYLFSPAADYSRPYKPSTITSYVSRIVASLGYDFHLHQLRHFAATQLISRGTDVATVSKRLGHSNTSVTLDIYTHVIADRDREAARILGSIVGMPELTSAP